jgi:hypothetical protein
MAGGILTLGLTGVVTDAVFDTTGVTQPIGAVTPVSGMGSSISVALDANATPANVAAFLNETTIEYKTTTPVGTKGTGTINVALTDAQTNTGNATRAFNITPLNLTVDNNGGAAHITIVAAVAEVAGSPGADGSTITVLSTYTLIEGVIIGGAVNDPDLDGLTLWELRVPRQICLFKTACSTGQI